MTKLVACIGSVQYMGLLGFAASLATLSGIEQDVALLLDRALRGMFGGAVVGLLIGWLIAFLMEDAGKEAPVPVPVPVPDEGHAQRAAR